MIDCFVHLDMKLPDPIGDLRSNMRSAGVERALMVEMWNGANVAQMRNLEGEQFRAAFCFRGEGTSLDPAGIVRVKTEHLQNPGRLLDRIESAGGWLLPHAEKGIAALSGCLIQAMMRHPNLRVYLPHLGWPCHDKSPDPDWPAAIEELAACSRVILGVSALSHFSAESLPYKDVQRLVLPALTAFGLHRLVPASDYPLIESGRYGDCIMLAYEWIRVACPSWSESSVLLD